MYICFDFDFSLYSTKFIFFLRFGGDLRDCNNIKPGKNAFVYYFVIAVKISLIFVFLSCIFIFFLIIPHLSPHLYILLFQFFRIYNQIEELLFS